MKKNLLAFAAASLLLACAPVQAMADRRHGGGHHQGGRHWDGRIHSFHNRDHHAWSRGYWHHGSHGHRLGWWWVLGDFWYWYPRPIYPYPDPYVPPAVIQQYSVLNSPPLQVQPQPQPQMWYYCGSPTGYYPYVPECPTGWQAVPAVPPSGSSGMSPPPIR